MVPEKRKRLLLVEDEFLIAMSERLSLEQYGYEVSVASTGEKAVQAVESGEEPHGFDLILMDIDLGKGIDGTEAATRILAKRDIPIVFLSSHLEPAIVKRTESITSYGYIAKDSGLPVLDASIMMAFRLFDARKKEKEEQAARRDGEERYRFLVDNAPIGIFQRTIEGDYLFFNECEMKQLECDSEKDFLEHFGDITQRWADLERLKEYQAALLKEKYVTDVVVKTIARTGRVKWFLLSSFLDERRGVVNGFTMDITERKLANDDLSEQKNLLRSIIESSSESIFAKDAEGRYRVVNEAGARSLGYGIADMIGRTDEELLPRETAADFRETDEYIKRSGERVERETTFVRDGRPFVYIVHKSPWRDESGKVIGVIGVSSDVTGQRSIERALREKEEYFHSVIDAFDDAVFIHDAGSGEILDVNRKMCELYGYTRSEALSMPIEVLSEGDPPYSRAEALDWLGKAREAGPQTFEWKAKNKGGGLFRVEVSLSFAEISGKSRGIAVVRGIGHREKAETALRESERKYGSIIKQARDGIVITGEDGKIVTWNESFATMTGIGEGEAIGKPLWQMQWILTPETLKTPQRLRAMKSFVEEVLESKTDFSRMEEGTISAFDGKIKILETSNFVVNTDKGKMIVAMFRDVSERRRIEESLRLSEAKYRSYVENATEGVFVTDGSGRYVEVNAAASGITGYSKDELLRMSITDLQVDEPDENEKRCLREFLETGSTRSEKRFKRKDGSIRWWTVDAVRVSGDISLALARDVTERRRQEQLIKSHLEEKELILKEVHHRVKNNLGTVKSLLHLQSSIIEDRRAVDALDDTERRVDSMMILYEKLYMSSNYGETSLKAYLSSLIDQIIRNFPNHEAIRISEQLSDFQLDAKRLQTLGIIVNEIITNIMKYAFIGRSGGSISVRGTLEGNLVSLSIQDDGNGMPESVDFDHSTGFGLRLIKELTRQIDGAIGLERGNGTRIVLEFER
jgi:PAS domain S-box-containing protein